MSRAKDKTGSPGFDELAAYLEGAIEAAFGRQATVTGLTTTNEFDCISMNIEVVLTGEVKRQ